MSPEIENVALGALIPYEFNNKVHGEEEIDRVANSIKEFGWTYPILVDENNVVLAGHKRLRAAIKLRLSEVPVLRKSGLSEAQRKAYRIIDNKTSEESEWDLSNLKLELQALDEMSFDVSPFMECDFEFEEPEEENVEDDQFEGEGAAPIERGDLIELGNHRILCGDSSDKSDVEKLVAGLKIDLMLTDPPYGVTYVGKTEDALTLENDDLSESDLQKLWNATLDAWVPNLKEGGSLYSAVPAGPLSIVFARALHERGILRQQLQWVKDSMVLGRSDYHYRHETILYGWKPGAAHYFVNDRSKTSVLEFARPKASREHPTMKPLELWAELISNSSKKGEIVADAFLGSGTTLIASQQLGRRCIGMEIEPKYCSVIIARFKSYCEDSGVTFNCKINGEPYG